MIYIVTGPICSGKTTRLSKWLEGRNGIGGILMPVIDGKRYFLHISSGGQFPGEAEENEKEVIRIGPYRFSKRAFGNANREILESFKKNNIIVIDEIGPIELGGKGFALSLKKILRNKKRIDKINLILVVREGLLEQVTENFKISDSKILTDIRDIEL